jgi:DNA repair photolyase
MMLLTPFDPWRSTLCTCLNKLTFNPYTGCDHNCIYCYATSYIPNFHNCRPKKNLIPKLEKEAQNLRGQLISISNSSDPYPTIEKELELTRQSLQALAKRDCRLQIITKSNLVTRDIDILQKTSSVVAFTITTDNDKLAKQLEPNAPLPSLRIQAIKTLTQNGISVCARIDPIIPTLNDNPQILIETLAASGVKHITASTYKVKPDNWKRFTHAFPTTANRLKPLYFERGKRINGYQYLQHELRYSLMKRIRNQTEQTGMTFGTCREGFQQLNTVSCDGSEHCQHSLHAVSGHESRVRL